MSSPKTPYQRRSYTQRVLGSITQSGGAGGRLDRDSLSPAQRTAANVYSSPVGSRASSSSSSSAGAPLPHDMSRFSEDEEDYSEYTDSSAPSSPEGGDDEEWGARDDGERER